MGLAEPPTGAAPLLGGITLRDPEGLAIAFDDAELALVGGAWRLTLRVDLARCQEVERRGLLNLRAELRSNPRGGRFRPRGPIAISADLRPDLCDRLAPYADDAAAAAAFLQSRAQSTGDDMLLDSESWFAQELSQGEGPAARGYRTIWSYLELTPANLERLAAGEITEGLLAFLRARGDLDANVADTQLGLGMLRAAEGELRRALQADLGDLLAPAAPPATTLMGAALAFYQEEGWPTHEDAAGGTIHSAYQGQHGRIACYAQIDEAAGHLVHYAVCPQPTPPARLAAMAELVARLNSGLLLGNLELSFGDGEVRAKTSIDVAGDRLTSALVRRVVYNGVAIVDYYLPAISALIGGAATPLQAIALVESIEGA